MKLVASRQFRRFVETCSVNVEFGVSPRKCNANVGKFTLGIYLVDESDKLEDEEKSDDKEEEISEGSKESYHRVRESSGRSGYSTGSRSSGDIPDLDFRECSRDKIGE